MRFSFVVRATSILSVAVAGALVFAATASATGESSIASACSTESVNPGFGKVTVRFVLHGHVSCAEAHRTMRAYARAIAQGRCTTEICSEVTFPGGWTCSATIPALRRPNGPIWGCERKSASFDVYKAHKPHRPTRSIPSGMEFYAGGTGRGISCQMDAGASGYVLCQDIQPTLVQTAHLTASGTVAICTKHGTLGNGCDVGNPGLGTPTFNVGKQVAVGGFTCGVLSVGVRCVVTATGKGFLMEPNESIRVG